MNSSSHYYNSEINLKKEKISELHLKNNNKSDFFNNSEDKFELYNNIISYDVDNNQYYLAPIGNYSDNLKINFYKILTEKNM